jgi:GrpB-like predicted nucleotidyltransferase (UPF0157 family)
MILALHDPEWAVWFSRLREVICSRLGLPRSALHHVGSTSVPGLAAKPIIDMDLEIPGYEVFDEISGKLQTLGYADRGDLGIPDRISFSRRDPTVPYCTPRRGWIDHHLYVCPSHSRELKRHLAFREVLLRNPKAREEYAALKRGLEAEAMGERKIYVALKEERARLFIDGLLNG